MFKRSLVALITPMREDGTVDEKAFAAFRRLADQGRHPRRRSGRHHRRKPHPVARRAPSGRGNRHRGLERPHPGDRGRWLEQHGRSDRADRHAKEAGADAALIVTPYYNKPTQEGMFLHYTAIADAVDLPIIIYNIPPRSVVDMSVETMARLAKHPNIVGVKDATANLVRPLHTRRACGPDFCQLSGEDHTALSLQRRRWPRLHQRHREHRAPPVQRHAVRLGRGAAQGRHGRSRTACCRCMTRCSAKPAPRQ